MATILAVGIGLHNFAIGLAIGQAFAGGADRLGVSLLLGFSLHSVTEGFGIAGVLIGRDVSWARLFGLGLVASLPTVLGAGLGGVWVSAEVELLCLSSAMGSLVYVARELLQPRFHALGTVAAASAIASGFLLGLTAELVTGVAHM